MNQFHFNGFEPDQNIRSKANIFINRILDLAPYGATAVAMLEKDETGYRCLVDVYSQQGPFMASTVRTTPQDAIQAVEEKIKNQIEAGRSHRRRTHMSVKQNSLQSAS